MSDGAYGTRRRITKRIVDALKPGDLVWDAEVRGFGVRCQRAAKIYVLKARAKGRQRWFSLGEHGSPLTVETARKEALRLRGEIAKGSDPAEIRDQAKCAPTVADLCARFLSDYAAHHKRPSSQAADERNIRNHVLPLLGRLKVSDVTRADIVRFKRAVREGKTARDEKRGPRVRVIVTGGSGAANRCLALLGKMFNLAERWGYRPDSSNPTRHVDKYRERKIERFLSEIEMAKVATALSELEIEGAISPHVAAAVRLLIFTGCRRDEVLNLRWADVDTDNAVLRIADGKTGARSVYLSAPALEALASIPRVEGNPHVICGANPGARLINIEKPWRAIRKRAGLAGLRLHDLRHTFASVGAAGGLSLPMIGKLLGHSQPQTTARYSHLAADPVRAANEAIGQRIAAAMAGGGGEVVPLAKRQG